MMYVTAGVRVSGLGSQEFWPTFLSTIATIAIHLFTFPSILVLVPCLINKARMTIHRIASQNHSNTMDR
jgi:hypothetical protein